jgi:ADP-ribose pyrophosphatase
MEGVAAMDCTEKTLAREEIYAGKILTLHRDRVSLPGGRESIREVVEHTGGVAVLPLEADGTVWCVRQFRYPYGRELLELPAGKLEPGEDPLACAVRELGEETGLTADRYVDLGEIFPSPGYCHESLFLYLAEGLHRGAQHLDADEFLHVERHPLSALLEMAMDGSLRDAKTVVALLKAERLLREREDC